MLAAHWGENDDASTNSIISYFADRQHTEKILRNIEKTINKRCFYCQEGLNCRKFKTYKGEFAKKGFWSFNRERKYWNVYDPDWSYKNTVFEILPIRSTNFTM